MVNKGIPSAYCTVSEVAHLLGISRIAVFKRIQKGQLPATKYGRMYLIDKQELPHIFSAALSSEQKCTVNKGVKKVVEEYGETLKLLGKG